MKVQPYLFFDGRCEEALEYYRRTLGAEVLTLMRFKDCPEPTQAAPGSDNKVLHGSFRVGDTEVLVSDGMCSGKPLAAFQGFSLALTVASAAEADKLFNALADGGQVQLPMTKTFFAERFGMVTDRFGAPWMVTTEA